MAAMEYLPVKPAAEDKNVDVEILAPANHDCQPIDSRIDVRADLSWRNYLNPVLTTNLDPTQTHRPESVAELDGKRRIPMVGSKITYPGFRGGSKHRRR